MNDELRQRRKELDEEWRRYPYRVQMHNRVARFEAKMKPWLAARLASVDDIWVPLPTDMLLEMLRLLCREHNVEYSEYFYRKM